LAVALIAGITIFNACKKEEITNSLTNDPIVEENFIKNYEVYIKELMNKTGIDIYKLSESDRIKERSVTIQQIMYDAESTLETKGAITEEMITQLESLRDAIRTAYMTNNENEVFRLFEAFCTICRGINGFIFSTNEYGWETFTFNPNIAVYSYFEVAVSDAIALIEDTEANNPLFAYLPEETQIELIAAAMYVNMQHIGAKESPDCRKEAAAMYAVSLSVATATMQYGLISCAFSGPGAAACCAGVAAVYGVEVAIASWQFHRALKRCQ
jgi:hypothetical protein